MVPISWEEEALNCRPQVVTGSSPRLVARGFGGPGCGACRSVQGDFRSLARPSDAGRAELGRVQGQPTAPGRALPGGAGSGCLPGWRLDGVLGPAEWTPGVPGFWVTQTWRQALPPQRARGPAPTPIPDPPGSTPPLAPCLFTCKCRAASTAGKSWRVIEMASAPQCPLPPSCWARCGVTVGGGGPTGRPLHTLWVTHILDGGRSHGDPEKARDVTAPQGGPPTPQPRLGAEPG